MGFYDEMQAAASEVLKEFKQGVIEYVNVVPGSGPADNPGPATETFIVLDAVASGAKFKYVSTGLALASDLQVVMAVHPDITPKMNGFIRIDGVRYKIVQVVDIPAAGTAVVYTLIVRK